MTDKANTEEDITDINAKSGKFLLQKVYVKDLSFETPYSPEIFMEAWAPKVDMHLSNEAKKVNEDHTEAVLKITITVKINEKTAYLVEVQMAGIFLIKQFPPEVMEHVTATLCPNMLFPFAREVVCDLVVRGGFPQLLLAPVNFEALYAQQKKAAAQASNPDEKSKAH